MPAPEIPRADDVTMFRELQRSTRHNTVQLEHLSANRLAAANRLAGLREKPIAGDSTDLIDEMRWATDRAALDAQRIRSGRSGSRKGNAGPDEARVLGSDLHRAIALFSSPSVRIRLPRLRT